MRFHLTDGSDVTLRTTAGNAVTTATESAPTITPPTGPTRNILTGGALLSSDFAPPMDGREVMVGTAHKVVVDAKAPTVEWDFLAGFGGATNPASVIVGVSTTSQPRYRRVTFAGQDQLDLGASPAHVRTITSDPLPVDLKTGDTITFWAWVSNESGTRLPGSLTRTVDGDPGYTVGNFTEAWKWPRVQGDSRTFRPTRVPAPSDKPSWLLGRDSIVQQSNCHLERWARAAGVAASKSGLGGDAYLYYPNRWADHFANFAKVATHHLDEFGTNDATNATSGLQIAGNALAFWKASRAAGIGTIVKTTITPAVETSDNYGTVDGQKIMRPMNLEFNAWLRDGAPLSADASAPVAVGTTGAIRCPVVTPEGVRVAGTGTGHPLATGGIVDAAAAVESTLGSGKWTVGWPTADYGDGLHPGPGGHQRVADRLTRDIPTLLAGTTWR